MSEPRQPGLGRLQDLIGGMKNVYLNDRDPNRADKLIPMMEEALRIVVRLRGQAWVRKQRAAGRK